MSRTWKDRDRSKLRRKKRKRSRQSERQQLAMLALKSEEVEMIDMEEFLEQERAGTRRLSRLREEAR